MKYSATGKRRLTSLIFALCAAAAALGALSFTSASTAQQEVPVDRRAAFVTRVPRFDPETLTGATKNIPADPQTDSNQKSPPADTETPPEALTQAAESDPLALAATFTGAPYIRLTGDVTATPGTEFSAETHIAVDPSNPSNLVAAISDFPAIRFGFNITKYAFSFDNGATWGQRHMPRLGSFFLATGDGALWEANSDPVVAIDKQGNAYVSSLYFNVFDFANGIYVGVGNVKTGVNITASQVFPVVANLDENTPLFEDKEWLAVDNSSSPFSGNVYVSWTRVDFAAISEHIFFSRSTNSGKTWSQPMRISLAEHGNLRQGAFAQGSQVAVGPKGEVYVVYEVIDFLRGRGQHFLAKSTDGGLTFSRPAAITPFFNDLIFRGVAFYRLVSFPAVAVSPTNGNVYVVWGDLPNSRDGLEVEFIRSTDGGATFSAPVTLNNTPLGHQFFPAITTDENGSVHVVWNDTRRSVFRFNFQNFFPAFVYDVFATRSVNNGDTFSINTRVNQTPLEALFVDFIGDYNGIAAGGGFVHPTWTTAGAKHFPGFFSGPTIFYGTMQTTTLR